MVFQKVIHISTYPQKERKKKQKRKKNYYYGYTLFFSLIGLDKGVHFSKLSISFGIIPNSLKSTLIFEIKMNGNNLLNTKIIKNSIQLSDYFSLSNPILYKNNKAFKRLKYNILSMTNNGIKLSITIENMGKINPQNSFYVQTAVTDNSVVLNSFNNWSMDKHGNVSNNREVYFDGSSSNVLRYASYWNTTSIPASATILSVVHKLKVKNNSAHSQNVEVVSLQWATGDSAVWTNIGDGSVYDTFKPSAVSGNYYNKTYNQGESNNFCSNLQNKIGETFGIGIRLANENNYGWAEFYNDLSLTITYDVSPNTTVQNEFTGGKVFVDDMNTEKNAPFNIYKTSGDQLHLKAKDNQTADDYLQFYSHWKLPNGNVKNNIEFIDQISDDAPKTYTANFDRKFNLTVHYNLVNGGGTPNDVFDGREEHSASIQLSPKPNVNVNSKLIDYNFLQWNDGNTANPRVFWPLDHEDYYVQYKGHLASDTSLATGHNNGRRMVWDVQNTLYMVYEDVYQIWFTQSLDTGATWLPEEKINMYYPQSNPSIAVNYNGVEPSVHVVYETLVPNYAGGFDHAITYQHKGSAGWEAPEYLDGYISSQWIGNTGERPVVVSETGDVLYIAWRDVNSGKIKVIYKSPTNGWSPITELSVTNGYPVIGRTATGTRKTKLIWSDGNDIKYTECEYNPTGHYWMTYYAYNMTGMFSYAHDAKPTMAIDANGIAHVAWQVENNAYGSKEILYHEYSVNNGCLLVGSLYSLDQTYLSYEMGDASISYQNGISTPVTIFYDDLGSISRIHWTGTNYGWSIKNYGSGKYPNTVSNHSGGAVWTKYNSAPYIIPTDYNASSGGFQKLAVPNLNVDKPLIIYQRFDFNFAPADSQKKDFISLILDKTKMNGQNITFNDKLESDNISFNGTDNIEMDWRVLLNNVDETDVDPDMPLLHVYIVRGAKKTLLKSYLVKDLLKYNDGVVHNLSSDFFHSAVSGRTGKLKLEFGGKKPVVTNMLIQNAESTPFFAKVDLTKPKQKIPTTYILEANYPNPFNPSTHIKFGIPQNDHVLLEIYTTAGQRIASLMDRELQAGTYETTFDASGLASGVYVYVLRAGRNFIQSKKMILLK